MTKKKGKSLKKNHNWYLDLFIKNYNIKIFWKGHIKVLRQKAILPIYLLQQFEFLAKLDLDRFHYLKPSFECARINRHFHILVQAFDGNLSKQSSTFILWRLQTGKSQMFLLHPSSVPASRPASSIQCCISARIKIPIH